MHLLISLIVFQSLEMKNDLFYLYKNEKYSLGIEAIYVTPQPGILCLVRVSFFFLVYSYIVKHLTLNIFYSNRLQNIFKLHK